MNSVNTLLSVGRVIHPTSLPYHCALFLCLLGSNILFSALLINNLTVRSSRHVGYHISHP